MNAPITFETQVSQSQEELEPSKAKIVAKVLLVAAIVAGLAAAVFFSGGALMGLISAGAAGWKIGLVTVGLVAASISLLGAGHFAIKHDMFDDTDDNLADAGRFIRDTLSASFHAIVWGIEAVKERMANLKA